MSRFYSYLNSAENILQRYKGQEPLASFLKKFFAQEKKFGSRDRKQISHLCYCYFRLGKALQDLELAERILVGLFLCSDSSNEILNELKPEWNKKRGLKLEEKFLLVKGQGSLSEVFPWQEELSDGIDHDRFCKSFFVQPDVYLRLRPRFEKKVKEKLSEADIVFKEIDSTCIAISQGVKIENVVQLDKEAVVQDLNSQGVGKLLILAGKPSDRPGSDGLPARIWDCCAGSGGKSLLAYDLIPNIDLTVSDTRESIIRNLKKRFASAGIKKFKSFVADLTLANCQLPITNSAPDLIICDVPCTGSGTWSRTPEQLYFFDEKKIEQYASLQRRIISNVIPHLGSPGYFLYITCSVFKKENEENVDFIKKQFGLELVRSELLKGYDGKADTLFVALFKKEQGTRNKAQARHKEQALK
jgi:16S rRNA (cytosine967-C5)-methyltransferase